MSYDEIVSLSPGNSKLGRIWSISLPPLVTCAVDAPCRKHCYARFCYCLYPNTKKAWDNNLLSFCKSPLNFFRALKDEFGKHKKREFFRFHIGGDIVNDTYFRWLCDFCYWFPETNVMAYTKKHEYFNFIDLPKNLSLCASFWPNWGNAALILPRFNRVWMRPVKGTEHRIPKNAFECPGKCSSCHACFSTSHNAGRDIVINEHGGYVRIIKQHLKD